MVDWGGGWIVNMVRMMLDVGAVYSNEKVIFEEFEQNMFNKATVDRT